MIILIRERETPTEAGESLVSVRDIIRVAAPDVSAKGTSAIARRATEKTPCQHTRLETLAAPTSEGFPNFEVQEVRCTDCREYFVANIYLDREYADSTELRPMLPHERARYEKATAFTSHTFPCTRCKRVVRLSVEQLEETKRNFECDGMTDAQIALTHDFCLRCVNGVETDEAVPVASDMYTSEPIPGRESPFYVGDRYVADAETARRARADMNCCAWCGTPFTAGFGIFCSRDCAMEEVRS